MDNGQFKKNRVVITGQGLITPLGHNVADTWAAVLAGQSGIGPFQQIENDSHVAMVLCEVKDYDPEAYLERRAAERAAPSSGCVPPPASRAEGGYQVIGHDGSLVRCGKARGEDLSRTPEPPQQRSTHGLVIAPRILGRTKAHRALVPLARHNHRVAQLGQFDGKEDRLSTVGAQVYFEVRQRHLVSKDRADLMYLICDHVPGHVQADTRGHTNLQQVYRLWQKV